MGEEVNMSEYETDGDDNGDEDRVYEWEIGLPNADNLTPLSQSLIPAELASAFSISPEPYRTIIDVNRESRNTLSTLCGGNKVKSFTDDPIIVEEEEDNDNNGDGDGDGDGSETRKLRKLDSGNEEEEMMDSSTGGKGVKRPRLVWTPQLHKRFVEVVSHLGIKNAVPKTIMQLMNVEGLTRENVASHLQKYRLYLKRMQVGEGSSSYGAADQLFASTTNETGGGRQGMPVVQMPVYGYHHRNLGFEAADTYKYYPQRIAPNDN